VESVENEFAEEYLRRMRRGVPRLDFIKKSIKIALTLMEELAGFSILLIWTRKGSVCPHFKTKKKTDVETTEEEINELGIHA
jgi:hypothetical protein